MEKIKELFESYNQVIAITYDRTFTGKTADELIDINEDILQEYLDKEVRLWSGTPLQFLEGRTPAQYIDSIGDLDTALCVFKEGARLSDSDLPPVLMLKLKEFGSRAEDEMMVLAADAELINNDDDIYIALMAVRTLGRWKTERAVGPLLDIMDGLNETNEILVEEINSALINIGLRAVDALMERIESSEDLGYTDEYLLDALVKIGKKNRSDSVYRCIKEAFIKMEDKLLGALCLGDYGDGRAIPVLKGYAMRNRDSIDKQTYQQIRAAVKKLGGDISDMK